MPEFSLTEINLTNISKKREILVAREKLCGHKCEIESEKARPKMPQFVAPTGSHPPATYIRHFIAK